MTEEGAFTKRVFILALLMAALALKLHFITCDSCATCALSPQYLFVYSIPAVALTHKLYRIRID